MEEEAKDLDAKKQGRQQTEKDMINSVQTKKPGERDKKEGKRGSSRVYTHTIGDLRLCEPSCSFL